MIDLSALKPHRGAYVEMSGRQRRCISYSRLSVPDRTWSEWEDAAWEGLLSFTREGTPKINGDSLCWGSREVEIHSCQALWRPPKDSLRFLCQQCQRTHPLPVALREARRPWATTSAKVNSCSICGGFNNEAKMVVPPEFQRFGVSTPYDVIEKEMVSLVFMRKMKDWNAELVLKSVERQLYQWEQKPFPFTSSWRTKEGAVYLAYHNEPLPFGMWARWIDFQELKSFAEEIRAEHQTVWKREVPA